MLPWTELLNAFGVHAGARLRRETTGDGLEREGMHWPDLDEDISVENLLLGKASGESQDSLRRWLDGRAIV